MPSGKQKRVVSPAQDEVAWKNHCDLLSPEAKHIIESETKAIREDLVHGSKLRIGQRFARVRKALAPDRDANAATKKVWSLYLRVNPFPGISRATGYRSMDSWDAAEQMFHSAFLDAFASSGLALGVSPSKSAPLGKYTDVARSFSEVVPDTELGDETALELVKQVVSEFNKNKPKPERKTRREQEQRLHDVVLKSVARIVKGFMDGADASTGDYRDELDEVVARLYGAIGVTTDITIEPKTVIGFSVMQPSAPLAMPYQAASQDALSYEQEHSHA